MAKKASKAWANALLKDIVALDEEKLKSGTLPMLSPEETHKANENRIKELTGILDKAKAHHPSFS